MSFSDQVVLRLIDWPVLAFILLVGLCAAFRHQIGEVLRRGGISIGWGDRTIKIEQLSASIDEVLDPIKDDLQTLKEAVAALESAGKVLTAPRILPVDEHPPLDAQQKEAAKARVVDALALGPYTWRSIERLAAVAGISVDQTLQLLRSDSRVVLGRDKSGNQIAAT